MDLRKIVHAFMILKHLTSIAVDVLLILLLVCAYLLFFGSQAGCP